MAGVDYAAENMLSRQPAWIVTLWFTHSHRLSDNPRHVENVTLGP